MRLVEPSPGPRPAPLTRAEKIRALGFGGRALQWRDYSLAWERMLLVAVLMMTLISVYGFYIRDKNWQRCTGMGTSTEARIKGCTALIHSGLEFRVSLAGAYNNRAAGYRAKRDYASAIADYAEAIRLRPTYAQAFHNRGAVYGELGLYDLAIADFNQAIQLDASYANAWNGRCWTRAIMGQLQEAVADCNESLKLRPNNPVTLASRALAYLKLGQSGPAINDYTQALKAAPKSASYLYGRGLAKEIEGDQSGAKADVAAAKRINSGIGKTFEGYGVSSALSAAGS